MRKNSVIILMALILILNACSKLQKTKEKNQLDYSNVIHFGHVSPKQGIEFQQESFSLYIKKWLKTIGKHQMEDQLKKYKVLKVENNQLTITGKAKDTLWDKADVLIDFVSPWDNEIPKRMEFRSLWDEQNFYFCFKVFDNQVYIDTADNSKNSIANSDRVELFFRSNDLMSPYYCLEMDPTPRLLDFKAFPNRNFDFNWNWNEEDITLKSNFNSKGFIVEGKISLESLKKLDLIQNNGNIETGIYRAKYNKNKEDIYEPTWITWVDSKTKTPEFHTKTSFGILCLVGY